MSAASDNEQARAQRKAELAKMEADLAAFKREVPPLLNKMNEQLADMLDPNFFDSVYSEIGRFLKPGALLNLCVALGKRVADIIRYDYLHGNGTFLRLAFLGRSAPQIKKRKILAWMDANPKWKEYCAKRGALSYADYIRWWPSIDSYVRVLVNDDGVKIYEERDASGTLLTRISGLLYIDGAKASWCRTWKKARHIQPDNISTFSFFSRISCIFRDPVTAMSLGLKPVLQHMLENRYIHPNDSFRSEWQNPSHGEEAITRPLLYHAISNSPDSSCLEYLLDYPELDCSINFSIYDSVNIFTFFVIHSTHITDHWPLNVLKKIIQHPFAPDINSFGTDGNTVLHSLCQGFEFGYEFNSLVWNDEGIDKYHEDYCRWWHGQHRQDQLLLLLQNGADPTIRNRNRDLPEDIFTQILDILRGPPEDNLWEDYTEPSYISSIEDMRTLIRRPREGQRDADQKTIIDFFPIKQKKTKRRRLNKGRISYY